MGKKAKKKAGTLQKEKRTGATMAKTDFHSKVIPIETVEDIASVVKEKKGCIHIEKGVNLVELSAKEWSSENVVCEDCRENAGDRRGGRGKGKAGKKKGHGGESNTDGKSIWVCLQCGHKACGGVGLPTTPQSHAVRHARQARHPLAVHYENPQLRWCFQCSTLIPVGKFEGKEEHKDVISDAVKIIQSKSAEEASGDVEDSCLVGESVKSDSGDYSVTSSKDYYVVRGLMNLGNTCFFNSVMQNLLAMDKLRSYFSNIDGSYGPLTITLKKLFAETSLDTGQRSAVNPKSFFGSVCARAPQFRGYQQQDSHELLRCLLDGLSIEELSVRKQIKLMHETDVLTSPDPSFVDAAFGGQVSSKVCCLECGHASTIYEPFLDLSLPVPTRKPPKKTQHVSVAKRAKVPIPPKRASRVCAKPKIGPNGDPNITKLESTGESSQEASSVVEKTATLSITSDGLNQSSASAMHQDEKEDDMSWLDFLDTGTNSGDCEVLGLHQDKDKNKDDMSWLDFLDSESYSGEHSISIEDFGAFSTLDSGIINKKSVKNSSDSGLPVSGDDEVPLLIQDSVVLLLPYKEESVPSLDVMDGQAFSSLAAQEEDVFDFSGFGDLFNEPEPAIGHSTRTDGESNVTDSGTTSSFLSESDPDEVDDASPVSIETCLAYFTKPEHLSREQGWCCEKCSKVVRNQKRKSEKKYATGYLNNHSNILEVGAYVTTKGHLSNGGSIVNGVNNSLIRNGDAEDDKNEPRVVQDSGDSSHTNGATDMNSLTDEVSSSISINSDSACANEISVESIIGEVPDKISGDVSDSEVGENKDTDSSSVKVARDATKRLIIEKAPPVLTIHLKRFSQDARGRLSKLNGHVVFGETIDLGPYMSPRCKDGEKYIYRLSGIVEHSGTMRGGHYVAYIRGGKKNIWYHASDAYVHEVSLQEVLRSEAYILFYTKME